MQQAVEMFKALGDETRLRILNLLTEREVCVCDIVDILQEGQSKISRHLAVLRHAGLVDGRREGMWVFYRLVAARSDLHQQIRDWLLTLRHQNADTRQDLQKLSNLAAQPDHCLEPSPCASDMNPVCSESDRQLVY